MDFPSVTQKKKKAFTLKNPLKIKNRYFKSDFVFTQLVYAPDLFCPGAEVPVVPFMGLWILGCSA